MSRSASILEHVSCLRNVKLEEAKMAHDDIEFFKAKSKRPASTTLADVTLASRLTAKYAALPTPVTGHPGNLG